MNMKRIQACLLILTFLFLLSACSHAPVKLITDAATLLDEIEKAESGTTLLVGDIDFTPLPGVGNLFARMTLKKNIHIQGGLRDRNAVFTDACFQLMGSKTAGEMLECSFSNITFDGGVSPQALQMADWEVPLDADGVPQLSEPLRAQYAVTFGGNVSARFDGCVFRNYMYESGPVLHAFYGDYTGNPELLGMFDDYSGCKLSIVLSGCDLADNAALYGGAVYLDGNNNVTFRADRCNFSGNISGCGEFSEGGGACRFCGVDAALSGCSFTGNEGNHCYLADLNDRITAYLARYAESGDTGRTDYLYLADTDRTQGGAIFTQRGTLLLADCEFRSNRASVGGALRLLNTASQIENCVFSGNAAIPVALSPDQEIGPWIGMGMGGAIYIDTEPGAPVAVYSTEITENTAQYAYGGISGFWTNVYPDLMPLGLGSIDLYACTIRDNACLTAYDYRTDVFYPWASHPGDILEIAYLNLHGCVLQDACYRSDFPRHELPSAENDYNFISAPGDGEFRCAGDIRIPERTLSQWNAGRKSLPAIDPESETEGLSPAVWASVCIVLVLAAAAVLLLRKRSSGEGTEAAPPEVPPALKKSPPSGKAVISASELDALKENLFLRQLLTDREMDVMCEYISGSSRSRLAETLMISEATAKTHISNIYAKLEVRSKAELVQKLKTL